MELKLATRYEVDVGDILLIVPYGIETAKGVNALIILNTFNRTLWN